MEEILLGILLNGPFAALVYNLSASFVWPFAGLVASPQSGGMILELSSFIAMFVYALIAWGW